MTSKGRGARRREREREELVERSRCGGDSRSCFIYLRPVASSAQVEFHSWNLNKGGQGFSPSTSLSLSRVSTTSCVDQPPPKPDPPLLPLPFSLFERTPSKYQMKIIKRKFRLEVYDDQMSTAVALYFRPASSIALSPSPAESFLDEKATKKKKREGGKRETVCNNDRDEFSPTFILVEITGRVQLTPE